MSLTFLTFYQKLPECTFVLRSESSAQILIIQVRWYVSQQLFVMDRAISKRQYRSNGRELVDDLIDTIRRSKDDATIAFKDRIEQQQGLPSVRGPESQ